MQKQVLYTRQITCEGFHRDDGLWEVEGKLCDTRGFDIQNPWRGEVKRGNPVHEMRINLVFGEDLTIRSIEVVTDSSPYPNLCPSVTANYQRLVGTKIGPGFSKQIIQSIGGVSGCTHQTALLKTVASAALQTLTGHFGGRIKNSEKASGVFGNPTDKPPLLNSCRSYADDGEVVKILWPKHYMGN